MPDQLHMTNRGGYKAMPLSRGALVSRSSRLPDCQLGGNDTAMAGTSIHIKVSIDFSNSQLDPVRERPSDTRLMHDSYRSLSRSRFIKKVVGMSRGRNAPARAQIQALSRPRQPGPLHGKA